MAPDAQPCYFTCTLGQAVHVNDNNKAPFENINEFIDQQADAVPTLPAVGFADLQEDGSSVRSYRRFTFRDIRRGTAFVADHLYSRLGHKDQQQRTIALLAPSCPEFLFAWLALIRLGHAVLLIAPQCQPAAIAHLCRECRVDALFFESTYQELAEKSAEASAGPDQGGLQCLPLGFDTAGRDFEKALQDSPREKRITPKLDQTAIAYLHHTSGTSTGLPKPIPQSHRAAIVVLPRFKNATQHATFTTTPLYHGGVADLFRSWTSNAMIWLFPGRGVPITAKNILSCLKVAADCTEQGKTPPVKYFSSVPYVLQMVASDQKGLEVLKSMDIAGVGGAALPAEVGDDLVAKGVNLISRFGSAECGFLLSSHRPYGDDYDWQYLRATHGSDAVSFEPREDGLYELVVLPAWPHRAKTNRPDGSYATSDLFAPHPSIDNAWKYHSRADSQLTLITGKKFDPAPLESAIATSALLEDVLIFGNGRPFPGALLFRSQESAVMTDEELLKTLAPMIEKLNRESQSHARLARNLLVPIAHGENKLEKSSKGTILRNKAEEMYGGEIEAAYTNLRGTIKQDVSDDDVEDTISKTVESIIGHGGLEPETDLFAYGVDSVASIQIRYTLNQLLPKDADELPLSVVEDCGSVSRLNDFILAKRHGETYVDTEDELKVMHDLVEEYSKSSNSSTSPTSPPSSTSTSEEVIVLTGATGALGAHILQCYRRSSATKKIYCLVRGADTAAASERVNKSLQQRGFPALDSSDTKINVLPSRLSDAHLGLDDSVYETLASQVTTVMHIAWAVNFRMRLRSFVRDHIAGVRHLLDLAQRGAASGRRTRFAFCSSVASVTSFQASDTVPEALSADANDAGPLGYARSKWVAEQVCARASGGEVDVGIFRVGQLAGDREKGIWNAREAWPTMLASLKVTGCLPRLMDERLTWLPVDVAARAMVEGAARLGKEVVVVHVVNDDISKTWEDVLRWLEEMGLRFEAVEPGEWLRRLEDLQKKDPEHASLRLLGVWQKAYGGKRGKDSEDDEAEGDLETGKTAKRFALKHSKEMMPALMDVKGVDGEYFGKLWRWIKENVESK